MLPWLICIGLLYYLFQRYPLQSVLAAVDQANIAAFAGFVLVYFPYLVLMDSWSLRQIFSRFGMRTTLRDMLEVRLTSNLAMIVNYGVGQGFLAYLIKRRFKVPLATSSSVLGYVILTDFYWALTIAFTGTFFSEAMAGGHDLAPWIRGVWCAASALLVSIICIWRLPLPALGSRWSGVQNFFATFHGAATRQHVKAMLSRLPLHLATSTYLYFLALCFGAHIPFPIVATLLPLTVIVGAIPITPSGLGTVQFTAIMLFQGHVSGTGAGVEPINGAQLIFAMSILFTASIYCLKLISGAIFLRRVMGP